MYTGIGHTSIAEHEYRNPNRDCIHNHVFSSQIPPIANGCCTIVFHLEELHLTRKRLKVKQGCSRTRFAATL